MRGLEVTVLDVKRDERGWLAEIIRKEALVRGTTFGQFLVTTAHPGCVKGNHYHARKYEWYCVLKGEGLLMLLDRRSGERKEMRLSEQRLTTVRIPPQVSHAIKSVGTEMMYLLIYTDEPFNEDDPDTFYEEVG